MFRNAQPTLVRGCLVSHRVTITDSSLTTSLPGMTRRVRRDMDQTMTESNNQVSEKVRDAVGDSVERKPCNYSRDLRKRRRLAPSQPGSRTNWGSTWEKQGFISDSGQVSKWATGSLFVQTAVASEVAGPFRTARARRGFMEYNMPVLRKKLAAF